MDYDFLVLGGGSAGYNGANAACRQGLKVGVVDGAEELGGLCILQGCMPSKAILQSANRYAALREASEFGISIEKASYSLPTILERKNRLVKEFADYRARQLSTGLFDLHRGFSHFVDPHTVEVVNADGEVKRLTAKTFLLATGSRMKKIPLSGMEETGYLTSDDVLKLEKIPRSLVVLGGGAIALEFAHFYAAMGVEVTIIQRSEQLLKETDGDVGRCLEESYIKRGIAVYCHTQLLRIEKSKTGMKRVVFTHDGEEKGVEAEEILSALGREPNLTPLRLEAAGLELSNGRLHVSHTQQTSVPHLFAAGDAAGPYEVVHIAIQQAELAARNASRFIKGVPKVLEEIDYRLRLFAVFSEPEVAVVGLTECEIQETGISYRVASYPFNDHGKSMLEGAEDGFVKLIVSEESGEILGGAVIGPHASELIHEIVVAMRFRATAKDLAEIPHYHPTLSEIWTYPAEELL